MTFVCLFPFFISTFLSPPLKDIYSFERKSDRERERHAEKKRQMVHPLVHTQRAVNSQGCARSKSKAQKSMHVSQVGYKN